MRGRLATVRARWTLLCGGMFLATTTSLLVIVNLLLQHLLDGKVEEITRELKAAQAETVACPPKPVAAHSAQMCASGKSAAEEITDAVAGYQWGITWVAVAVLAVLTVGAAWWLTGRLLRPLHVITATAKRLSFSRLDERIGLRGPRDELKELADTFDDMLRRLHRAADSQRRFIANASHELRTPLSVQRAAIEIGLDNPDPHELAQVRTELLEANLRTERLIDGLLMLAQGERGLDTREPVRLDALANEAVDLHRETAAAVGVTLEEELDPLTVTGDPVLLTRLIANLVQNAVRYNRPGGHVRIRTSPEAGLTVSNTGPKIPADLVTGLFEPFRRLHRTHTASPEGAGLGLSIVAAIANSHDTHLTATPNPGGGLTVTVQPRG